MSNIHATGITRRDLLQGAAGLSLGGVLAACGSSKSGAPVSTSPGTAVDPAGGKSGGKPTVEATGSGSSATSSGLVASGGLPTYIRYEGTHPDIPATNEYSVDGFLKYPTEPVQAVPVVPGQGGSLSFAVYVYGGIPSKLGSNRWWQEINKRVGAKLDLQVIPVANYWAKLSALIASGDLPDVTHVSVSYMNNAVDAIPAEFVELSEFVGGDNVKDFPMLANLPSDSWQSIGIDGRIFGVPQPVLACSQQFVGRADIMDKLKVDGNVKSADEFTALCAALTDTRASRWAFGQPGAAMDSYIQMMFGVPNQWRVEGGKYTNAIETDEFVDALQYRAGLWKSGYVYPDTYAGAVPVAELFASGKIAMMHAGGTGILGADFANLFSNSQETGLKVDFLAPPRADGGGLAPTWLSAQSNGFAAINKKLSKDKIRRALGVLDVLAAPFGTAEYTLTNYGVEGVDYTRDSKTNSIGTTSKYNLENPGLYNYPGSPNVFFMPGYDYITKAVCEWQATETKNVAPSATLGLISKTELKNGGTIMKRVSSARTDITVGRRSIADWKNVVSTWRKSGGDTIRAEYEAGYAKAHQ